MGSVTHVAQIVRPPLRIPFYLQRTCDRDGFRERFLAELQGIFDDVDTLKNDCKDAVKESEEFANDGVSLKTECSGRDVNVRALTKRIRVFQGMKDAVENVIGLRMWLPKSRKMVTLVQSRPPDATSSRTPPRSMTRPVTR